jgi:hypothetical protein
MSILSSKEKKEIVMEKGLSSVTTLSVTLVLLSIVAAICIYGLNERKLMAANIENAIAKGVDPLSVRCSYAKGDDIICIAHAATRK